jgi:hydroxymethylglutaryl-CoA lyase
MDKMKLIECPRDAMQGMETFIPTALKIEYINLLIECGFDTIDFGSFVSPLVGTLLNSITAHH